LKYDPSKKQSRGVERTQRAFTMAMFDSLAEKPFDKITVNAICQKADYPRATFYNYFDDKFDLLNCCWYKLGQEIHLDVNNTELDRSAIMEVFAQTYKLFYNYQPLLLNIIKNNPLDGQLVTHFIHHFTKVIGKSIETSLDTSEINTPAELVARHCSSTVLEVLEWIFLGQNKTTLEEAEGYLEELLTGPVRLKNDGK